MKKRILSFLLPIVGLMITGCDIPGSEPKDPGENETPITQVISVESVSLNKQSATLEIGGTVVLQATVLPDNATEKGLTWKSDHPEIATVENGVVTAKAPGEATITVTTKDGGKTAICTVTVNAPVVKVTSIELDKESVTLEVNDTVQLNATVLPSNATNTNVNWSSDGEEVATVENGLVTAVAPGTATITAKTEDGEKVATCDIVVIQHVESVELDKETATLEVEGTVQLNATVLPETANDKSVTWSSENEEVATVENGLVTAVAPGNTTITVTTHDGEKTDTCEIVVNTPTTKVGSVSLDVTSATLDIGGTVTLTETVLPADATNKTVSWSTDDETVATVENGVVTAVGAGTAVITVTTEDQGKTATCTIKVLSVIEKKLADEAKLGIVKKYIPISYFESQGTYEIGFEYGTTDLVSENNTVKAAFETLVSKTSSEATDIDATEKAAFEAVLVKEYGKYIAEQVTNVMKAFYASINAGLLAELIANGHLNVGVGDYTTWVALDPTDASWGSTDNRYWIPEGYKGYSVINYANLLVDYYSSMENATQAFEQLMLDVVRTSFLLIYEAEAQYATTKNGKLTVGGADSSEWWYIWNYNGNSGLVNVYSNPNNGVSDCTNYRLASSIFNPDHEAFTTDMATLLMNGNWLIAHQVDDMFSGS